MVFNSVVVVIRISNFFVIRETQSYAAVKVLGASHRSYLKDLTSSLYAILGLFVSPSIPFSRESARQNLKLLIDTKSVVEYL